MGGRDHSCEGCGRGGFNDPDGACECPTVSKRALGELLALLGDELCPEPDCGRCAEYVPLVEELGGTVPSLR